jgi:hypothetical protein
MGKYQEGHNLIMALLQHFATWTKKKHFYHDSMAHGSAHNCTRTLVNTSLVGTTSIMYITEKKS